MTRQEDFGCRLRRGPRGAALVILIAVFAVTMTLASVWTRRVVDEIRWQRAREQAAVARQLAESGIRRAAAQLAQDASFRGEVWNIDAIDLGGDEAAEVQIDVNLANATERQAEVVARARYPVGGRRSAQHTESLVISLPEANDRR